MGLPRSMTVSMPLEAKIDQNQARIVELLTGAGGQLCGLTAHDLVHYLPRTVHPTHGGTPGERAASVGDRVLDELRERPDTLACTRLTAVLSTPLMVMLARTRYGDTPRQDPAVLLDSDRFPTRSRSTCWPASSRPSTSGACRPGPTSPGRARAARGARAALAEREIRYVVGIRGGLTVQPVTPSLVSPPGPATADGRCPATGSHPCRWRS